MRWETVLRKFNRLSEPYADSSLRREIAQAVAALEKIQISRLLKLLPQIKVPATA
jgi:2-methylcitrate dehydratase